MIQHSILYTIRLIRLVNNIPYSTQELDNILNKNIKLVEKVINKVRFNNQEITPIDYKILKDINDEIIFTVLTQITIPNFSYKNIIDGA